MAVAPKLPPALSRTSPDVAHRALVRLLIQEVAQPDHASRISERLAFLETRPTRWLKTLYPHLLRGQDGRSYGRPFAQRHLAFWRWVRDLAPGVRQPGFIAVWPRGGAKSTSVEMAVAYAGATRRRRFVLYVCETQRQANDHVGRNIASNLQSARFAEAYPEMSHVAVTSDNRGKGWNQSRLFTASGFKVDAIGLDAAARGIKIEGDRPDLIVLDDIDDVLDSPGITAKKIATITRSILPSGGAATTVLGAQNLIQPNSVFSRLVKGDTDFLIDAHISGPDPAIQHLEIGYRPDPNLNGRMVPYVAGGVPTWDGQGIETVNADLIQWGVDTFLAEAQHEVDHVKGSMFEGIELASLTVTPDEMPPVLRTICCCDPAVTSTDQSDSNGIAIGSLCDDMRMYVRWTYERRSSPLETLRAAIIQSIAYGADTIVVETDQGGDTWEMVYLQAIESLVRDGSLDRFDHVPPMEQIKAGAGYGPKVARGQQLLGGYQADAVRHVQGGVAALGQALGRFPLRKPLDLVDALFWVYNGLILEPQAKESLFIGSAVKSNMR